MKGQPTEGKKISGSCIIAFFGSDGESTPRIVYYYDKMYYNVVLSQQVMLRVFPTKVVEFIMTDEDKALSRTQHTEEAWQDISGLFNSLGNTTND